MKECTSCGACLRSHCSWDGSAQTGPSHRPFSAALPTLSALASFSGRAAMFRRRVWSKTWLRCSTGGSEPCVPMVGAARRSRVQDGPLIGSARLLTARSCLAPSAAAIPQQQPSMRDGAIRLLQSCLLTNTSTQVCAPALQSHTADSARCSCFLVASRLQCCSPQLVVTERCPLAAVLSISSASARIRPQTNLTMRFLAPTGFMGTAIANLSLTYQRTTGIRMEVEARNSRDYSGVCV